MSQFRKKPVVIEAHQLPRDVGTTARNRHIADFLSWTIVVGFTAWVPFQHGIEIETLEGILTAQPGDWIIKGVKGEFYPCKSDVFAVTYDLVEAE